jgi:type II secretory pathway component PulJ
MSGRQVRTRARQARRARRGATLIELMLGTTVLVVALLGAVSAAATVDASLKTSRETNQAAADLAQAMEQLLLVQPRQLPIAGSEFEADQPIAAFEGLHLPGERIVPNYPNYVAGAQVPDPLQIVVTISWTDHRGRARTMRAATLRTR